MTKQRDIFDIAWSDHGPLDRTTLDAAIYSVQQQLDLVAVVQQRYGARIEENGDRQRTACFLPSTVPGFRGSCARQDASERGSAALSDLPKNLWISDGDVCKVWRCHSCKRHGDVIDLIEHADQLPRAQGQAISLRAVRVAAQLAGVSYVMDGVDPRPSDVPALHLLRDDADDKAPRSRSKPTVSFDVARSINAKAISLWHGLLKAPPGGAALRYLHERGVTDEQIERYRIGYATDNWRDLADVLDRSVVEAAVVLGLVARTRYGKLYDRFRHRVIFPYCEPARADRPASITGFAGRTRSEDPNAPKWLNSTNTPGVWTKKSAMVGLYQAIDRARELDVLGIGEGAWEACAFDRAGLPATGLVSAELTAEHCEVIASVVGVKRVRLAFDGDAAGRRATIVGATELLLYGFALNDVTVLDCPAGKDPDELSIAELQRQWHEPTSVVDFGLRYGEQVSMPERVALLAALPEDASEHLRSTWGIDATSVAKHKDRALPSSPTQALTVLLLREPGNARHLGVDDVRDALSNDAGAWRRVAELEFADATNEGDLPITVRRAWLACRLAHVQTQLSAHDKIDPFAMGSSADHFRTWYTEGERLRAESVSIQQRMIAAR